MYKNILVAIDPTHEHAEDALHMGLHLAEDAMSRVTALTVVAPIPSAVALELPDEVIAQAAERMLADLRRIVGPNSEVATVVQHGNPGPTIVEYARDNAIDCIVIASHKPGLSDYFLGSTAARVVRHAPCAVHVMR